MKRAGPLRRPQDWDCMRDLFKPALRMPCERCGGLIAYGHIITADGIRCPDRPPEYVTVSVSDTIEWDWDGRVLVNGVEDPDLAGWWPWGEWTRDVLTEHRDEAPFRLRHTARPEVTGR